MTLEQRVWSSPRSPGGSRLRSQGSTPSLLSLQRDGSCRLTRKPRDPTWPESLADRQRHPLETVEEMVSKITKQQNPNTHSVIIHCINYHNHHSYETVVKDVPFLAPLVLVYTATQRKHNTCSIPEASTLRINDMTSGYSVAFKSNSLPDQQESFPFIHPSCIPKAHLHHAFDSFQSVSRTVNNGAASAIRKKIFLSSIRKLCCSLPQP